MGSSTAHGTNYVTTEVWIGYCTGIPGTAWQANTNSGFSNGATIAQYVGIAPSSALENTFIGSYTGSGASTASVANVVTTTAGDLELFSTIAEGNYPGYSSGPTGLSVYAFDNNTMYHYSGAADVVRTTTQASHTDTWTWSGNSTAMASIVVVLKYGTGVNIYTQTLTDSASVTEATAYARGKFSAVTDTTPVVESTVRNHGLIPSALTDSLVLSDSSAVHKAFGLSSAELVSLVESFGPRFLGRFPNDSPLLIESFTKAHGFAPSALSDTYSLLDAIAAARIRNCTLTDLAPTTESFAPEHDSFGGGAGITYVTCNHAEDTVGINHGYLTVTLTQGSSSTVFLVVVVLPVNNDSVSNISCVNTTGWTKLASWNISFHPGGSSYYGNIELWMGYANGTPGTSLSINDTAADVGSYMSAEVYQFTGIATVSPVIHTYAAGSPLGNTGVVTDATGYLEFSCACGLVTGSGYNYTGFPFASYQFEDGQYAPYTASWRVATQAYASHDNLFTMNGNVSGGSLTVVLKPALPPFTSRTMALQEVSSIVETELANRIRMITESDSLTASDLFGKLINSSRYDALFAVDNTATALARACFDQVLITMATGLDTVKDMTAQFSDTGDLSDNYYNMPTASLVDDASAMGDTTEHEHGVMFGLAEDMLDISEVLRLPQTKGGYEALISREYFYKTPGLPMTEEALSISDDYSYMHGTNYVMTDLFSLGETFGKLRSCFGNSAELLLPMFDAWQQATVRCLADAADLTDFALVPFFNKHGNDVVAVQEVFTRYFPQHFQDSLDWAESTECLKDKAVFYGEIFPIGETYNNLAERWKNWTETIPFTLMPTLYNWAKNPVESIVIDDATSKYTVRDLIADNLTLLEEFLTQHHIGNPQKLFGDSIAMTDYARSLMWARQLSEPILMAELFAKARQAEEIASESVSLVDGSEVGRQKPLADVAPVTEQYTRSLVHCLQDYPGMLEWVINTVHFCVNFPDPWDQSQADILVPTDSVDLVRLLSMSDYIVMVDTGTSATPTFVALFVVQDMLAMTTNSLVAVMPQVATSDLVACVITPQLTSVLFTLTADTAAVGSPDASATQVSTFKPQIVILGRADSPAVALGEQSSTLVSLVQTDDVVLAPAEWALRTAGSYTDEDSLDVQFSETTKITVDALAVFIQAADSTNVNATDQSTQMYALSTSDDLGVVMREKTRKTLPWPGQQYWWLE